MCNHAINKLHKLSLDVYEHKEREEKIYNLAPTQKIRRSPRKVSQP